tara:strand:- start:2332 stop:2556 length:225 start_codon:yes stop_codon:yes gene_type:complete
MTDDGEPEKRNYDYLQDSSIEAWSWEFTRRNHAYRKAHKQFGSKPDIEPNKDHSTEISKEEATAAARFGLLFFR